MKTCCRVAALFPIFLLLAGQLALADGKTDAAGGGPDAPPPPPPPVPPGARQPADPAQLAAQAEALLAFLPEVVARYGDHTITARHVKSLLLPGLISVLSSGREPPPPILHRQVTNLLNTIINQQLLLHVIAAQGFKPDLAAAKQHVDAVRSRISAEAFDENLRRTGLSVEQITERTSEADAVKRWIKEKALFDAPLTEEAVHAYYDEHPGEFTQRAGRTASHILFAVKPDAPTDTKVKRRAAAVAVLHRLREGFDFAEMARKHSDCPTGARGGQLGFYQKGQLGPEFEEAAAALEPDEISRVIETPLGFHIIKGGTSRQERVKPYSEVAAKLRSRMEHRHIQRLMDDISRREREGLDIEIFLPKE